VSLLLSLERNINHTHPQITQLAKNHRANPLQSPITNLYTTPSNTSSYLNLSRPRSLFISSSPTQPFHTLTPPMKQSHLPFEFQII